MEKVQMYFQWIMEKVQMYFHWIMETLGLLFFYLHQWSKWCCYTFKGSAFCGWHKYVIYQQYEQKGQLSSKTDIAMNS